MFRIKRLYTFVLETFLPLILATFSVCLFILLMQFLWRYIDEMVGKGVAFTVLTEMFFYAALQLIPMALPLSILLASLMTFGNLGEHLELLAMKSSGISLIRIMKPLIIFILFIVGISFVFQNNILPLAQKKLYTIIWSLKQKSPELNIPKGVFYKDIPKYNLYVGDKTKDGLLLNVMIYDHSMGVANMVVMRADSAYIKSSEEGNYLLFTLNQGKSFKNKEEVRSNANPQPGSHVGEAFVLKEHLIEYDSNFNMADESIFEKRDISKNLKELKHFADSVQIATDSVALALAPELREKIYKELFLESRSRNPNNIVIEDTAYIHDFQLFFDNSPIEKKIRYLENADSKADRLIKEQIFQEQQQTGMKKEMKGHQVEFYKKFSLSLACLFFFFIGAPLGAIIRKGGLGMPAVLSVIIFLLYYSLDTFGLKMAKTGVWEVWQGVLLSSVLLVLLGIFFTYKAVNDSVIMNPDAWKDTLQRLIGRREVRNYTRKEVIMEIPDYIGDIEGMQKWDEMAKFYLNDHKSPLFYISFWRQNFEDKKLYNLVELMEVWIEDLKNSDENLIIGKLMDYPIIQPLRMDILNVSWVRWICALCLPIGLTIYFIDIYKLRQIRHSLQVSMRVNEELRTEIIKLKLND